MTGKKRKRAQARESYGVSLVEFRASYRAVRDSRWWYFFAATRRSSKAERRHACFVATCTLVLPLQWHKDHPERLTREYYVHRNLWLALWRPIYRAPVPGIHPELAP